VLKNTTTTVDQSMFNADGSSKMNLGSTSITEMNSSAAKVESQGVVKSVEIKESADMTNPNAPSSVKTINIAE